MDDASATIFVCVSCQRPVGEAGETFDRPGRRLVEALQARLNDDRATGVTVMPVDCLAVCKRPCTVALSGDGKWTYLIGDVDADAHADEIVAAARSYAASDNGIVPWKERPASFRKGVIARVPPIAPRSILQMSLSEAVEP